MAPLSSSFFLISKRLVSEPVWRTIHSKSTSTLRNVSSLQIGSRLNLTRRNPVAYFCTKDFVSSKSENFKPPQAIVNKQIQVTPPELKSPESSQRQVVVPLEVIKRAAEARKTRALKALAAEKPKASPKAVATKIWKIILKVDNSIGKVVLGTGRGLLNFVKNPLIVIQWSKSAWGVVKHEAKYYWTGFRLLGVEIRTSVRLSKKRLTGHQLSRREKKQLVRTTADVFRVVPFAFFIVVPFLEFAIPVIVKLFPGFLPSTFEDRHKKEEAMKKQLNMRIEIADFMQDMVIETSEKVSNSKKTTEEENPLALADLEQFIHETRLGRKLPQEVLYKVTKLFSDELTIENMSRPQLVLLCRYMGLSHFASDNFLRMQLRSNINNLRNDDQTIYYEGVDSLSLWELKQACHHRGMNASNLSRRQLQNQLTQWLDLSVNKRVPMSLLILSRAFIINDFATENFVDDALGQAIAEIDTDMTKIALAESLSSGEAVDADLATRTEKKLEAIMIQNQLIETETKGKVEAAVENKGSKGSLLEEQVENTDELINSASEALENLQVLTSDSAVELEAKKFSEVVSKLEDTAEEITEQLGTLDLSVDEEDEEKDSRKKKLQIRLQKRLNKMLGKIETELGETGKNIGDKLRVLDTDRDGIISNQELKEALQNSFAEKYSEDQINTIVSNLDLDNDGVVSVEQLREAIELMAEAKLKEE